MEGRDDRGVGTNESQRQHYRGKRIDSVSNDGSRCTSLDMRLFETIFRRHTLLDSSTLHSTHPRPATATRPTGSNVDDTLRRSSDSARRIHVPRSRR
jgi:hypothetical protein